MKFSYEIRWATRIKLSMNGGDVQQYALNFLAIYNNVKNDKDLLKVYNDYDNGVYLICEEEITDAAVEFLKQFGTVTKVERIEVVCPICDYDLPDDHDIEFLEVEE